jgi:hypothetical protein
MKRKKTIDYINELRFSSNRERSVLGENLLKQYRRWTRSLRLKDMLDFLGCIRDNKEKIGVAQFFGRFRASSFEEFIYRILRTKVDIPEGLQVFWGEKCLVWRKDEQRYGVEVDIAIGRKLDGLVKPAVAVDAKVELDAARLKTALASMLLLKQLNKKTRCFIVYINKEVSNFLLAASDVWVDGVFEFSLKRNEIADFLRAVQNAMRRL